MSRWIVTRDVTPEECWWLPATVPEGAAIYRCAKPTYGAVKDFPATLDADGGYPFFELPWDAVEQVPDDEPTREQVVEAAEDRAEQAAFEVMRERS